MELLAFRIPLPTFAWDLPWCELDINRIHLPLLGHSPFSLSLSPCLSVPICTCLYRHHQCLCPHNTPPVRELLQNMTSTVTEVRFSVSNANLIMKQGLCIVRKIGSFLLRHKMASVSSPFYLQKSEKKIYESGHNIVRCILMTQDNSERCHCYAVWQGSPVNRRKPF
jgi:hypothetical protein